MSSTPASDAQAKAIEFGLVVLSGSPNPTKADVVRAVHTALAAVRVSHPDAEVNERTLRREIEARASVFVGEASALGDDRGHVAWLNRRRSEIDWGFWDAYRRYQLAQGMPLDVVNRLNDITDDVVGRLESPDRSGAWDRRGLVVGQVQSGKTSNYTGLVAKAADAGYKVIVVLAGLHNSLRSQTQRRLDEGFLGLDSRTGPGFTGTKQSIGVGLLGTRHPSALSLTSMDENGDFAKAVASRITTRIDHKHPPVLLVVKKHATILTNLIEWLTPIHQRPHPDSGRLVVPDLPLLVIDDEADHASVNTKDVDVDLDEDGNVVSETDPTTINRLIRTLLFAFEQSAYVGYTATPFANIFIYQDRESPTYGEDLFPRSFVVRIPPPSNYTGPAEVFGIAAADDSEGQERPGLPILRAVKDSDDWIPPKHKKHLVPGPLPASFRKALHSFVLTCAARAARGQRNVHNSMLVHVTRFVDVQGLVTEQVSAELHRVQNQLRYGDGEGAPALRQTLQRLWENDYIETTQTVSEDLDVEQLTWDQVAAELPDAAARIGVRQINGTAGDALEYTDNPDGVSVIAVGGDKLSRGLTLEGLTVSYYLRASRMYDTLMQMGRWFGYRPGYTDLCRLFTTPDLQLAYRSITLASEELLTKFDEMAASGSTPENFALYVRTSPDGLMVTAPAKMRNTKTVKMTFSGGIVETTLFQRDEVRQTANRNLAADFVRQLEAGRSRIADSRSGNFRWDGIPGADVASLLRGWETAETADKARGPVLAQYVTSRVDDAELTDWMVCLVNKRDAVSYADVGGLTVGLTERAADGKVTPPPEMFVVRRLVNPTDEQMDMSASAVAEALRATQELWDAGKSRAKKRPARPSGPSIRELRPKERGLLMLYPMDAANVAIDGFAGPLMGFAVSFPNSPSAPTISYRVPVRYWQPELFS